MRLPVVAAAGREERVELLLVLGVRDGPAHVEQRGRELPQGARPALPLLGIARPHAGDADIRPAAQLLGQQVDVRQRPDQPGGGELVRGVRDRVAPGGQHARGVLERVGDVDAVDLGAELVQPQLELGDDAEVAAAAAQRPVEVGVLVGAGAHAAAVGEHDAGRDEVVDGHPVAAALVGDPAAEREAGDAGLRHHAAGRREAEGRRHAVDVGPGRAALHVTPCGGRPRRGPRAAPRGRPRSRRRRPPCPPRCGRRRAPRAADRSRTRPARSRRRRRRPRSARSPPAACRSSRSTRGAPRRTRGARGSRPRR